MKAVCILLFCMAAVAFAEMWDDDDEYLFKRDAVGSVKEKTVTGGYKFRTTLKANGKYKCECFKANGKQVYAAVCAYHDKGFSYSECE